MVNYCSTSIQVLFTYRKTRFWLNSESCQCDVDPLGGPWPIMKPFPKQITSSKQFFLLRSGVFDFGNHVHQIPLGFGVHRAAANDELAVVSVEIKVSPRISLPFPNSNCGLLLNIVKKNLDDFLQNFHASHSENRSWIRLYPHHLSTKLSK